jgi:CHASE3 domain sensor protein
MNMNKTILVSTTVVLTLALVLAPLAAADDAFAGKKNKKDNFAQQIISQVQKSSQNSQVVSGGNSIGSGNNINLQFQSNSGNNALAQSNN